jgi:pimeloyl-ACP methyl ester carboxylesterase
VRQEVKRQDGIAYREAGPSEGPPVLLVHGYPESSYMWRDLIPPLANAGFRAVAPDLPGFGDSPPAPPGTWENHVAALERLRRGVGIERAALVVHDWGGLIGLRWACDHPDAVRALVISSTGFFADGKWHALAQTLQTEGAGEELIGSMTRDGFAAVLREAARDFPDDAIDEYWKAYADEERRRGQLELYRSGDFEKLRPYEGKLGALGLPALLLWGAGDRFAPVASAKRFHRELPDSELVVLEDAAHFVYEEAPQRAAEEVVAFLGRLR